MTSGAIAVADHGAHRWSADEDAPVPDFVVDPSMREEDRRPEAASWHWDRDVPPSAAGNHMRFRGLDETP